VVGGGNGGSLIRIFICQKTLQKASQLACQEAFFTNIFSSSLKPLLACKRPSLDCFDSISSHYLRCVPATVGPEGVIRGALGEEGSKNTDEGEGD
jgi:hypothetical protein